MEVPILYYDPDGSLIFRSGVLQDIFQKVGSAPFITVSVNGFRRTGKSYLLTQILGHIESDIPLTEWGNDAERPSVRIEIWPEPIPVRRNGRDFFLILIKSQSSFEPPATVRQNATVAAVSLLLSSFFILNMRKTISKESLAFLQYYLNLSKSFKNGLSNSSTVEEETSFQRIFFCVRDMDLRIKDFAHGYHTPTSKPPATAHSQTNLYTQIFSLDPTRQPLESQHTYRQVLSSFQELGLFALPELPLSRSSHRNREMELEFQNYIQVMIELLLSSESGLIFNEPKRLNRVEVTGFEFLEVVDQLERVLSRSSAHFINENNGTDIQTRADMSNIISTSNLVSLYVSTISEFINEHIRKTGNPGMYRKTMAEKMNSFLKICLDTFSRRLSQGDEATKAKYRDALCEEIQEKMKLFESLNESRIKYERQTLALSTEFHTLVEKLTTLRSQVGQVEEEELWTQGRPGDREIERRLRKAHNIHLEKQIEECQGEMKRIQMDISHLDGNHEKNIQQILKIIQTVSKF